MSSPVQGLLDLRDKIAKGIDWIEKQDQPAPKTASKRGYTTALEPYGFLRKPLAQRKLGGKKKTATKTRKPVARKR